MAIHCKGVDATHLHSVVVGVGLKEVSFYLSCSAEIVG